jgi:hypothetical protein
MSTDVCSPQEAEKPTFRPSELFRMLDERIGDFAVVKNDH